MSHPVVLDLPLPPSLNRIWRRGRHSTYLDPKYAAWKDSAGAAFLRQRIGRRWTRIDGPFQATLILCRRALRKNADIDNRFKAVGDFIQSVGLVADDKHCVRLVIEFGEAPLGCRLCICSAD